MYRYYPIRFRRDKNTKRLLSIEALEAKTGKIVSFNLSTVDKLRKQTGFDFNLMRFNGSNVTVPLDDDKKINIAVFKKNGIIGVVTAIDKTKSESMIELSWYNEDVATSICHNIVDVLNGDLIDFSEEVETGVYGSGVEYTGVINNHNRSKEQSKNEEYVDKVAVTKEELADEQAKQDDILLMDKKDQEVADIINKGIAGGLSVDICDDLGEYGSDKADAEMDIYELILKRMYAGDSITIPHNVYCGLKVYMEDTAIKTNLSYTKYTCIVTIDLRGRYVSGVVTVDEDKPVKLLVIKEYSRERMNKSKIADYKKRYTKWYVISERMRQDG